MWLLNIRTRLAPWPCSSMITGKGTPEPSPNVSTSSYSETKLLFTILSFRCFYLATMAVSCHFIPEHNPGDDVLRFDMRLHDTIDCYCLRGHACDGIQPSVTNDDTLSGCAIPANSSSIVSPRAWRFLLNPLTKWDAARFLNLAVNPSMRDPQQHTSQSSSYSWDDSEQAHAFLPMFPWTIQQLALSLYKILPYYILPPTFESLVALSGMIFNNIICLTVATLALYNLTIIVMTNSKATKFGNDYHLSAIVVCLVFGVWNPALVFFTTNYSESFFAATTFLGHLCIQRSKIYRSIILWFAGIACWMIGSYTRSNGTLHCLWLLQDGLARILSVFSQKDKKSASGQVILIGIQSIAGAILVVFPVRLHDFKGWERHCAGSEIRPLWCDYGGENPSVLASSFSLYRYIQDKHWNVGFFRYYEWKQIPNFILAAPILILSFSGVYRWIHWALITVYGKGKAPSSVKAILVGWPVQALSDSVSSENKTHPTTPSTTPCNDRRLLLENPRLLGHYAILAILAFAGSVFVHVQVSTRFICSASPAIVWLIAHCLLTVPRSASTTTDNEQKTNGCFSFIVENLQSIVWLYSCLFMTLGVILHVNFLPWT